MGNRHTLHFTAGREHIDELGHVNNAVWVRWIQDIATAHWNAVARPEDRESYVWMVTRRSNRAPRGGEGMKVSAATVSPSATLPR